jgi:hypothetical protein
MVEVAIVIDTPSSISAVIILSLRGLLFARLFLSVHNFRQAIWEKDINKITYALVA